MALAAPRSLKEPMGCRFSSLIQTSAGAPSEFRRKRGVRTVTPARRSRAARISSIVGAVRGCISVGAYRNLRQGRIYPGGEMNSEITRRVPTLAPLLWVLAFLAAALAAPAALEDGTEIAGGDDPGAAQVWFARRLPAMKASGAPSLAARYLAAQAHVRRMAHHPGGSLAWKSLGPGNLGGRTRALVFDPADPRTLYAGGVDGGIWKTVDGGASWRPLDDLMPSLAVTALAIDSGDRRVLYAGTGEGFFNTDAVRGAGIFKTADSGRRWRQLAATATPDFFAVNRILVSAHSRTVYAATGTGVWRSRDAGVSWERVLDPQAQGGCLDLALRHDRDGADDVVFAACGTLQQATVYQTLQGQKDGPWMAVLQEPGMGRTSLAIAPSDPDVIYALATSNL